MVFVISMHAGVFVEVFCFFVCEIISTKVSELALHRPASPVEEASHLVLPLPVYSQHRTTVSMTVNVRLIFFNIVQHVRPGVWR